MQVNFITVGIGLLGLVVAGLVGAVPTATHPFDLWSFAAFGIWCVLLLGVMVAGTLRRLGHRFVLLVDYLKLAGLAAFFLARQYAILFIHGLEVPFGATGFEVARWVPTIYLWVPTFHLVTFTTLAVRPALVMSLAFLGAMTAMSVGHVVSAWLGGVRVANVGAQIQLLLVNGMFIALTYLGGVVIDQYVRMRAVATTMTQYAHTDFLTGVPNRRAATDALARLIGQVGAAHRTLAVIMLDLDQFKQVNDQWGHTTGDRMLSWVVDRLRQHLRPADLLGRWGGEEFVIVVPDADVHQTRRMAERLREAIAADRFERTGAITASFGVAEYEAGESVESLVRRADDALLLAKAKGKNQVATAGHI